MAEQNKIHTQTYFKGCDSDTNPELVQIQEGRYYDSYNFRLTSIGKRGTPNKVKGEDGLHNTFTYPNLSTKDMAGYECIGTEYVKGYKVCFWANDTDDPCITIDDMVVCETADIGFSTSYLLQINKNESCQGGEVFPTDNHVEPLIFNVQDLLDKYNAGDMDTYFDEFNKNNYSINIGAQNDVPVLSGLVSVAVGKGLKVGYYAYSIRYVDAEGNRTKFGSATPLIPVPFHSGSYDETFQYPAQDIYGQDGGYQSPYGIKLKFRVTNTSGYKYIEIRRVYWNGVGSFDYVPAPEVYQIPTNISAIDYTVADDWFTDSGDITWTPLSDDEETTSMSAIKRAKTVRYYDRRLVYGNIGYASRDISGEVTFKDSIAGNKIFPFLSDIERIGYGDVFSATYKKSYQSGEKYSFAIVCHDDLREDSFAESIESNFYFPNRREVPDSDTIRWSALNWKGLLTSVNISNSLSYVQEAFAFRDPDGGFFDTTPLGYNGVRKTNTLSSPPLISISEYPPWFFFTGFYNPLTPKFLGDTGLYSMLKIDKDFSIDDYATTVNNLQNNLMPTYYARGAAIQGIDFDSSLDWVKSFTVVRSKRANRVIAQGIGFYSLDDSVGGELRKDTSKIIFFSDDIYNVINQDLFEGGANRLKVQFVSPLGFNSEIFSGNRKLLGSHNNIDMALYAYYYYKSSINMNSIENSTPTDNYYTYFGSWRNPIADANTIFGATVDGNKLFDISVISQMTRFRGESYNYSGRITHYYEITLADPIYVHNSVPHYRDSDHQDVKDFHEPLYIVNIVDENAEVPELNVDQYVDTGVTIKRESIIGKSTGDPVQTYQLVDERWEDCIPNQYSNHVVTPDTVTNTFCWVKDSLQGTERAWINVTNKPEATIDTILTDITNNGYYNALVKLGVYQRVYGIYWHTWPANDRDFVLSFYIPTDTATVTYSGYSQAFMVPPKDSLIIVKYDNRFPIKVFGGDTWVGPSIFSPIDGQNNNSGDNYSSGGVESQLKANVGFPYKNVKFEDYYCIVDNAVTMLGHSDYQANTRIDIQFIRQMCVLFTCESVMASPFLYHDVSETLGDCYANSIYQTFPRVHYIQRPNKWNNNCVSNFGGGAGFEKISDDYLNDFPGEFAMWGMGGLRYLPLMNIDYSQYRTDKTYSSVPIVGYTEQNDFCTGVIWSVRDNINQQDSPGLKTFPSTNFFAIDDKCGEIKYLFDSDSDKGDNIYAITEKGVCLMLTNKRTISDSNSNLAFFSTTENFIGDEYWLSKRIGMNDEMWRSAGEYDGALFFANNNSLFMLYNNNIEDIARSKQYYNKVYSEGLSGVSSGFGTKVCAGVDKKHAEYWLDIGGSEYYEVFSVYGNVDLVSSYTYVSLIVYADSLIISINGVQLSSDISIGDHYFYWNGSSWIELTYYEFLRVGHHTFVYNIADQCFQGKYDYQFEKYVVGDDDIWGVKSGIIYSLDLGYTINGQPIRSELFSFCNPDIQFDKEYIAIAVSSDSKPTRIDFSEDINNIPECSLYEGMSTPINTYYLKDYGKWTNKIPRKELAPRDRLQSRYMAFDIIHQASEDITVSLSIVNYKVLKLQI